MLRFASPLTVNLARGELLAWQHGRVHLHVVSGLAWVTRPNDLGDHFLHAGQMLELSAGLIGAEEALCVRFEVPQRRRTAPQSLHALSCWLNAARAAFVQSLSGALRKEPA